jgi:succinate dehydrogenase / fumarate reductase cytochrome b subunit
MLTAVTGMIMLFFIVIHLSDNAAVFSGIKSINVYAAIREFPLFIWTLRIGLGIFFLAHLFLGIMITLENNKAQPQRYYANMRLSAGIASKTMIWTGILTGLFVIFHVFHFNAIFSFQKTTVFAVYVIALTALYAHLFHGIQSVFQTMGLNSDRTFSLIINAGRFGAVIVFSGYILIAIAAGILRL